MMIDFEDKMPAPPMSLGEKVFMVFIVVMQGAGLISTGFYVAGLLGFG